MGKIDWCFILVDKGESSGSNTKGWLDKELFGKDYVFSDIFFYLEATNQDV